MGRLYKLRIYGAQFGADHGWDEKQLIWKAGEALSNIFFHP